jgi:hypothetical protein
MLLHVTPSGDDCHCLDPALPVEVKVTELPLQTGFGDAVMLPPNGLTVTVTVFETSEQVPFVIEAR